MSDNESQTSTSSSVTVEYEDTSDYDIEDENSTDVDEAEDKNEESDKYAQKLKIAQPNLQKYEKNWSSKPTNVRKSFELMQDPVQPNFPDTELGCFSQFLPDHMIHE